MAGGGTQYPEGTDRKWFQERLTERPQGQGIDRSKSKVPLATGLDGNEAHGPSGDNSHQGQAVEESPVVKGVGPKMNISGSASTDWKRWKSGGTDLVLIKGKMSPSPKEQPKSRRIKNTGER